MASQGLDRKAQQVEKEPMLISEKRRGSIIIQVTLMFVLCVVITGMITYVSQRNRSDKLVKDQLEFRAGRLAAETSKIIHDYAAYAWILDYWHNHAKEMDIEYDADFVLTSETAKKAGELQKKYPDIQLRYATKYEIESMAPEDQKKYAEVVYSWILTRLNEIKSVNRVDYLFIVETKAPYDKQFFVMSAADPGAVRGTEYEQVYTIGVESEVSDYQKEGMKNAAQHVSHLANAGQYVDYYSYLDIVGGRTYLIGMTYDYYAIIDDIDAQTKVGSVLSMLYQVMLLAACLLGIYFLVLNPLKYVQSNIRLYRDTKDSKIVDENLSKLNLNNEIGELATDVTDLSLEMDNYLEEIKKITSEKERIGVELSLASRIQQSMIPHNFPPFPDRKEFDIYASMDPAREVGGDFYDFFMVDDDHLGLVMADVSGKGIPAALFMMISKTILKSVAMLECEADEILNRTNEALCSEENQVEMFVTVWAGILEISTGIITAANAGHEYPVIKNPDGNYELLKDPHGLVIGGAEGFKYKSYQIKMEPGSKLFLYTDGIPEATDADKNMFGIERMVDALNSKPDADPKETLEIVRNKVDEFVKDAEQFDDLTMMCFEYKGKQ